jgi:hypothetical protein
MTTTTNACHILMVDHDRDYEMPSLFGPFATLIEAQTFAADFREANDLPREATDENNEAWTDAGWYFGIFQPSRTVGKWA